MAQRDPNHAAEPDSGEFRRRRVPGRKPGPAHPLPLDLHGGDRPPRLAVLLDGCP